MSILLILLSPIMKQHLNSLIRHDKRFSGMGSLYAVDNSSLQGLRKWAVKGFKKYLIFYLDQEDFITIVLEKIIGSADE
jgi:hypothetical protein